MALSRAMDIHIANGDGKDFGLGLLDPTRKTVHFSAGRLRVVNQLM